MSFLGRHRGEILLVLACLCYSFEWYFVRAPHAAGFDSWELAAAQMALATLVVATMAAARGHLREIATFEKRGWSVLVMRGILGAGMTVAFNEAVTRTEVANVLVLLYTSIFWAILMGALFAAEKITGRMLFCGAVAFAGIALALAPAGTGFVPRFGTGEIIALGMGIFFALGMTLVKKSPEADVFSRLTVVNATSAILLVAVVWSRGGLAGIERLFDPALVVWALALALFCNALAVSLRDTAMRTVRISTATIVMLAEPIAQMATAAIWAHELPAPLNLAGIALVLAAATWVSWKPRETGLPTSAERETAPAL